MPRRNAVIKQLRKHGVTCLTREEWGSARLWAYIARRKTHPMPKAPAKYHFLHITVTADTDTIPAGKLGAQKVESYGLSTPPMVSYQDMITNEGIYYQGQDYGTKGTHTINDKNVPGFPNDLNLEGYALAIMQNVDDPVTDRQVIVAAMVFAAREIAGWVRKGAPIYPHRKFAAKACPGDRAVARMDEIERLKNYYVEHGLPRDAERLSIIGWNIYIRNKKSVVRAALKEMIEEENPDIIFLFEATNMFGDLGGLGYEVAQLKPRPLKKGNRPAQGNIAVLTKRGHERKGVFKLVMEKFWRGPKHGLPQDPRVYRWILFQKERVTWKVGGWHGPFGKAARWETVRAIRKWFRRSLPGRPVIGVADANYNVGEVQDLIGDHVGAEVAGKGVEVVAFKNCRLVAKQELAKFNSDHNAMKYIFEAD